MSNQISEVTRRGIVDFLSASGINWAGRLPEDDFLARLYDLTAMPSTDRRVRNAAGDINQHRINWPDWPAAWVFYDERFNLLRAPDDQFLRFLCETAHPVVRPDPDQARNLVAAYNRELAADGWSLVETKQLSGRPVFAAQKLGERAQVFEGREVLISVAQEVYDSTRHQTPDDILPSDTDAGRMLEGFFTEELKGGANEEARAHAKAALRLTVALQHKRTPDFRMAALCAEATSSVVNIAAVAAGRRGRSL